MSDGPRRIGTVGAGNMAEAILRGLLAAGRPAETLFAADPDGTRLDPLVRQLGIRGLGSNREVADTCDLVVLAVKPADVQAALAGLPGEAGPLYLSIVAGLRVATLRGQLGAGARIARAMPNTPALVGAGISALADDSGLSRQDADWAESVLQAVGGVVRTPETLLDAVTGLSGSGPAYVCLFIEALSEAGVREGLASDVAETLALETVLGTARLVRESGEAPARLREKVSSPGGTTLAGLAAFAEAGFRPAVLAGVAAATRRARELGRDPG